jgi:hypothetical protein
VPAIFERDNPARKKQDVVRLYLDAAEVPRADLHTRGPLTEELADSNIHRPSPEAIKSKSVVRSTGPHLPRAKL